MSFSFIEKYKTGLINSNEIKSLINESVYCESKSIRLLNNEPIINNQDFLILLATKTLANTEHDDE
mgnify:CR=1 FL=1